MCDLKPFSKIRVTLISTYRNIEIAVAIGKVYNQLFRAIQLYLTVSIASGACCCDSYNGPPVIT